MKTKLFGTVYQFKDIKEVLAKANEERSGDRLAGIAAKSVTEMIAAKEVLSNLTLKDLRNNSIVPYEEDEVTRVIQDLVNEKIYNQVKNRTVAELREWILDTKTRTSDIRRISRGLMEAIKKGAPADMIFQSIAGTHGDI
ncbi:ethanolamine ammonia-lyase subunit EutB [Schnuerera ultunensis]|uniref:ethanolamine ammonia-lyase subunit EutB n=1 Tax=Schnuerera ultunensis TaxID=45497 RepID=UPI002E7FB8C1|nr:ethanolamine ammonia-lyase subunit EutB [Schnuerera ultunensis]